MSSMPDNQKRRAMMEEKQGPLAPPTSDFNIMDQWLATSSTPDNLEWRAMMDGKQGPLAPPSSDLSTTDQWLEKLLELIMELDKSGRHRIFRELFGLSTAEQDAIILQYMGVEEMFRHLETKFEENPQLKIAVLLRHICKMKAETRSKIKPHGNSALSTLERTAIYEIIEVISPMNRSAFCASEIGLRKRNPFRHGGTTLSKDKIVEMVKLWYKKARGNQEMLKDMVRQTEIFLQDRADSVKQAGINQ